MSYTTVVALWPGERIATLKELSNGHGSAPVIWDALCQRYLGLRPFGWISSDLTKLWALWRDERVPLHQRAVLMLTFDRAYVTSDNYARMALDIRDCLRDLQPPSEYVNHWPTIAALLADKPACPAIGLHCTSVSENPFLGPWNEEREEHDPIDWTKAYDLYAELDGLSATLPPASPTH